MTNDTECDLFLIYKLADGSWRLEHRNEHGVYPHSLHVNGKSLLGRMAQLLETGPITPQFWPERGQIS